jgi:hypothetical protein
VVGVYRWAGLRNHRYCHFLFQIIHISINCPEGYDFDILRQYLKLFPNEALTRLIQTYLAYLGIPLSSEEETATTPSGPLDDVFGAISVSYRCNHISHACL